MMWRGGAVTWRCGGVRSCVEGARGLWRGGGAMWRAVLRRVREERNALSSRASRNRKLTRHGLKGRRKGLEDRVDAMEEGTGRRGGCNNGTVSREEGTGRRGGCKNGTVVSRDGAAAEVRRHGARHGSITTTLLLRRRRRMRMMMMMASIGQLKLIHSFFRTSTS